MAKFTPAVVFAFLLTMSAAIAQTYPSRQITVVVGYPAGGPTDTIARILAERMSRSLGQPLIVENVTGASGSIGTGRVAHAKPDGYTVIIGDASTHVYNGAIYKLQYDVEADFAPVSVLPGNASLILVRPSLPVENLRELIAWIKANPDKAVAATAGVGSPSHISLARLQDAIGVKFQLVPYRGAAPAVQEVMADRIDFTFNQVGNALPMVRAGKVKALAVTAKERVAAAPDIPSVDEAGLPGFYVSIWRGLWAPKGTPKDVIAKLNAAAVESMADPAIAERLATMGEERPPTEQQTPEGLARLQKEEIKRWWPVIQQAGIRVE